MEKGRNLCVAESWAKTITLVVNKMRWKAALTKKFLEVVVQRILPLEVVYGASVDRPWDTIRDIERNHRRWGTQQTKA